MIFALRLALLIVPFVILTLLFAPLHFVISKLSPAFGRKFPLWWHRTMLKMIGVRVRIHGSFCSDHPLFLVSNHVSWADILVLGSVRDLCFIAKSEIGNWPGIKYLARMQRTVFVDRGSRSDTANQADSIAARLLDGDAMVLFAEGTTGDGNRVKPFNSSLLGAAQYAIKQSHIDKVMVQPVALAYTGLQGMPLGRFHQSQAAWPGDVELGPHLMNFLKKSAFDVDVILGEPLEFTAETHRKRITRAAYDQVRAMFGEAMRGKYA